MSDTMTVGKRLVELCNQHENLKAIDELYADNVKSIELMSMPDMPAEMEGIEAIRGKNVWWLENHELHSSKMLGPFPHGDRFIVVMEIDVTPKVGPTAGNRVQMSEAGIYTVKDGKIVQEEWFYDMEDCA